VKNKLLHLFLLLALTCLKINAQLPELVVQKGNNDSINSISYSPDGKNIISVSRHESTVKIWERVSGRLLKTIAATASEASYNEDGTRILIEEPEQYLMYDAGADTILYTISRVDQNFSSVSFANKTLWLVVAGKDSVVEIKRTSDGVTIQTIHTKHARVLFAKVCPDNKHLFIFSADSTVSVMDAANDSVLYELHFPGLMTEKCILSKTGKYAVLYLHDRHGSIPGILSTIKPVLIETATGKEIGSYKSIFDISPDETSLLGITSGNKNYDTVSRISIRHDSILFSIKTFSLNSVNASYSNDGKFFAVWNYSDVQLYDCKSGSLNTQYPTAKDDSINALRAANNDPGDGVNLISITVSPDSKSVALGLLTGKIIELNVIKKSQDAIKIYEDPFNAILDAQFVPKHPYIFTHSLDNYGIIWNIENAGIQYLNDLTFHGFGVTDFTFLPQFRSKAVFNTDGSYFTTLTPAGITLWQTEKLKKRFSMETFGSLSNYVGISPGAKLVCQVDREGDTPQKNVYISSVDANGHLSKIHTIPFSYFFKTTLPDNILVVDDVSFKGDDRHVVVSFSDQAERSPFIFKTIQFRDSISVLAVFPYFDTLDNHITKLHSSFSKKLNCYIVCTDNKIYIINPLTGKIIKTVSVYLTQPQLVDQLAFDPETKYVYIKDLFDKKIYAVDVATGEPVYFLKGGDSAFSNISFSPDNSKFITLSDDKSGATVWDAATGNFILSFKGHTTRLLNAVYSADGKFILCCAQDGSYEKRDAATGRLIYTFFLFKDYDYAIILPEGYYYVSSRADVRYLNFRFNNKLYNFSQFDLQFNRPDKILQALGSTDTVLMRAYHAAWVKRITKSGFTEADFSNYNLHVPDVNLQNKETLPAVTSEKKIALSFSLADTAYKIIAYTIYINDVPIDKMNGTELDEPSNNASVQETVALDSGINKIEISCINEKGAESRRETFYITYQPAQLQVSKTWFIGIGINHYSHHGYLPNLSYCVKDIRDLAAAFKNKYGDIEIDTLINDNANRQNIVDLKKLLMQTSIEDRVIISFSGHGLTYDDEFYFATPGTDPQSPVAQGVSYADMEYLLDGIPARKKLLLIDACYSGEKDSDQTTGGIVLTGMTTPVITESRNDNHSGNSSVEIIDAKSDPVTDSLKAFNIFGIMKAAFVDLRKNIGAIVIAASQSNQQAQETRQFENGVFTSCLLDQLKANAKLGVSELLKRMNDCVAEKTTGQQPASRQSLAESDWKLW
jgi:WD40 repeat protein